MGAGAAYEGGAMGADAMGADAMGADATGAGGTMGAGATYESGAWLTTVAPGCAPPSCASERKLASAERRKAACASAIARAKAAWVSAVWRWASV
jgi:hypothetical protein